MQKRTRKQNIGNGLRTAGLLLLCVCGTAGLTACASAEAVGGLFSFDIASIFQSFTSHYTSDTTKSNASTGTVTTVDDADLRPVIETITHTPTQGQEGSAAQSKSDLVWVDYTNATEGYVMVQYLGSHTGQIKLQLAGPDGTTYTYNLTVGAGFEVFPLTGGSGTYTLNTYEQDSGTSYYLVDSLTLQADIADPLSPYLYPNQFVNYSQTSTVVSLSAQAATGATSELTLVENVYETVMDTLSYDYSLAEQISSGGLSSYIPNLDSVIASEVGICFDYASLMVAMLRIQGVPAKLVIGYAGEAYHAWINVYTEENGWVDRVIQFDGKTWTLMDPTFADTSGSNNYVGDGTNYTEKYVY